MCHPLNITSIEIDLTPQQEPARVDIEVSVRVSGKTGVEMEAMTAVSVAGLTIYDMCKAVDREMSIGEIRLFKKSGGKSGTFIRKE
jgi:cyclic pyranopterin phosphate synthase